MIIAPLPGVVGLEPNVCDLDEDVHFFFFFLPLFVNFGVVGCLLSPAAGLVDPSAVTTVDAAGTVDDVAAQATPGVINRAVAIAGGGGGSLGTSGGQVISGHIPTFQ